MTFDQVQSLIRSILKIGGGFAVAKGYANGNDVETITAGLLAIAGIIWGLLHRAKTPVSQDLAKTASMIALGLVFLMPLTACTTFQDTAGKVLTTTAATVDKAMQGWATYVVLNQVPEDKQTTVRAAYAKYQLAMAAAEDAYLAGVQSKDQTVYKQAEAALIGASGDLTALIQSFETPTK